jgi:hypothetical protein
MMKCTPITNAASNCLQSQTARDVTELNRLSSTQLTRFLQFQITNLPFSRESVAPNISNVVRRQHAGSPGFSTCGPLARANAAAFPPSVRLKSDRLH